MLSIQAKTESQVDAEKEMLKQEKVWVVHRHGFSLGVIDTAPKSSSSLSSHINIIRSHVSLEIIVKRMHIQYDYSIY